MVADPPYVEGEGDRGDLSLPESDVMRVKRRRDHVDRLVLVILSGRPLLLGPVRGDCDAIVGAWFPGSEAAGVADVLTGVRPFRGRLPRRWPCPPERVADPDGDWSAAWERGHGCAT